jgi:type I restriction enzyme S subunit
VEPASDLLNRILCQRRHCWDKEQLRNFSEKGKELPENWNAKYRQPNAIETKNLPPLPETWCWASLDQLGKVDRGRSKHRPRDARILYGGQYPFIQTGDVRKARQYVREHSQTYSEEGLKQSRLWPAETLCITIAANIAETAILSYPACFPDSVVGVFFDPSLVCVRYVELFMRSAKTRISAYAPATAQKNINNEILRALPIPLPPLDEQQAIVDCVEDQLSVLEHTNDDLDVQRQNALALRQTILRHAFTGRLVFQDPNDEPAAELLRRIAERREARGRRAPPPSENEIRTPSPTRPITENCDELRMMDASQIGRRAWSYAGVLQDAGLSCFEYVEQLTLLLFLKMADQLTEPPYNRQPIVPPTLDWKSLLPLDGAPLEDKYRGILEKLGVKPGMLGVIFKSARCEIHSPALLKQLIVKPD